MMIRDFAEVFKSYISEKVTVDKSRVMVLGGEKRLVCDIIVDGSQLKQSQEFQYLGFVLDESSTDRAEFHGKVLSAREVPGVIR